MGAVERATGTAERIRAFEDPEGEVYLAYNARELADELNAPMISTDEARQPGDAFYVSPDDLTMFDDGVILENEESGESVDVDAQIAEWEAALRDVPRSDVRNRGMIDCIWTYYCESNGY